MCGCLGLCYAQFEGVGASGDLYLEVVISELAFRMRRAKVACTMQREEPN